MALLTKQGTFSTGAGGPGTNVVVTGVGFQPKAIMFWWVGRSDVSNAVGGGDVQEGIGFATAATERNCFIRLRRDGQATNVVGVGTRDDALVATLKTAAADFQGRLDLVSMDSDGFTMVVDSNFSSAVQVHYLALGGDDITNAKAGIFNVGTTSGASVNVDVADPGFQPDFVFMGYNALITSELNTALGGNQLALCAFNKDLEQFFVRTTSTAGADPSDDSYRARSGMLQEFSGGYVITATAMLASGFRLNVANHDGFDEMYNYLAIKGPRCKISSIQTRTDGNDIAQSGFRFVPKGIAFFSPQRAATSGSFANDAAHSVGFATSPTERGAQASYSRNGVGTTQVSSAIRYDAVYARISSADAIEGLMDLKSIEPDGFTCVMDDADPGAAAVFYVAMGDAQFSVAAAQGSYSINGGDTPLRYNRIFPVEKGDYALNGQAAGLLKGYKIMASVGAYALNGQEAVMKIPGFMRGETGAFALNGQPVSFTRSYIIPAQKGALAITGQAVTLRLARGIVAAKGNYSIDGKDIAVSIARQPRPAAILIGA